MYWQIKKKKRTLLLNLTPSFIGKNVDLCLLNGDYSEFNNNYDSSLNKVPAKYIALGELKGGIDPAGADEHWKTANTALERIRIAFKSLNLKPHTFFIGAAIEKSMAQEIYTQMEAKTLTNAANLTNEKQLISICEWICKV